MVADVIVRHHHQRSSQIFRACYIKHRGRFPEVVFVDISWLVYPQPISGGTLNLFSNGVCLLNCLVRLFKYPPHLSLEKKNGGLLKQSNLSRSAIKGNV
jgi:hypothetical protein